MNAIGFMAEPSAKTRSIGAEMEVSPCLNAQGGGQMHGLRHQPAGGGGMNPFDKELGQTQAVCHQGGVMQVQSEAIGFKAEQSAPIADILSQMRYIVRRLTPVECMRLMGLPDDYAVPTGLRRFFNADGEPSPELVSEFVDIFDKYNAIMAEYAHKKPPKGKSYNQVAAWLKKISDPATCPDSPVYKAAGNGWATNQPRWILTRLLAKEGVEW